MGDYKTSVSLQTQVPSVSSVTLGLAGTSDPSEARYWTQKFGLGTSSYTPNKYAHPNSLKFKANSNAIVNQVLFGPPTFTKIPPLAVVSGPRVSLYTGHSFASALKRNSTGESQVTPDRNVVTGGHPALCASYRHDGRLLAIGTDAGEVRICDATSRATLATFRSTPSLPIQTVSWLRNGKQVLSGGNDGVLRLWNLNAVSSQEREKSTLVFKGHGDAIRCALVWQPRQTSTTTIEWKQLAMSGSYDHTIRIWNMDEPNNTTIDNSRCLGILQHGAPVEALLLQPNADESLPPWLISAGGTILKVWNPLSGKCVCNCQTQHSKTITSLIATVRTKQGEQQGDSDEAPAWRIVTTGLDGLLRIHTWNNKTGEIKHIHGVKLSSDPITTMAVNETHSRLVFGTATGYVFVKERSKSIVQKKRKREPRAGTYAYFVRGHDVDAGHDFVALQQEKKRKLATFDLALRQFRYGDALDDALQTRQPQAVVAVLEELGKRRGLTIALSNRDEETLEPLLSFTVRYISRPQFSSLLIGVAHKLCDIYGNVAGQSETIDELFDKLRKQVQNECRVQKSLLRIVGQLDGLMGTLENDVFEQSGTVL